MSLAGILRRQPRVMALLFGLGCAAIASCAAELGLRASGPAWLSERMSVLRARGPARVGSDFDRGVISFRHGLPVAYKPGASLALVDSEWSIRARIDEWGGRALPHPRHTRPLLPFLGDSFTFGLGVNDDATFVALLQPQFTQELVDLGMPGASLPHYRSVIEQRHDELARPPVYVIGLFLGNDLDDLVRFAAETTPPTADHAAAPRKDTSWQAWRAVNETLELSWLGRSYLYQYLKRSLLPWVNRYRTEPLLDPIFLLMGGHPDYERRALKLFAGELDALHALAQQQHLRLFFVLIPDRHQVIPERRALKADYYSIARDRLDPLRPNAQVAAALTSRGFGYIDATPALAAAAQRDRFYYRYDSHLTPLGHTALAHVLAERLPREVAALTRELEGVAQHGQ